MTGVVEVQGGRSIARRRHEQCDHRAGEHPADNRPLRTRTLAQSPSEPCSLRFAPAARTRTDGYTTTGLVASVDSPGARRGFAVWA